MPYIHEGEDLYLAADQETVVKENDPRAAYVLVVRGGTLPDDIAEKHGLTGAKAKGGAPANKLRVGMVEDKAELQQRTLAPGERLEAGELPPDSEATDVEFTPAPAFEEALNEEKPKRKKG
jgi:hypothetical protein